jgi:hypothetical protein
LDSITNLSGWVFHYNIRYRSKVLHVVNLVVVNASKLLFSLISIAI